MTAPTDLDDTLANIRARAEAATEGPWTARHNYVDDDLNKYRDSDICFHPTAKVFNGVPQVLGYVDLGEEDAEFIAHARADVELLLKIVAEQRAVITRVREVLAEAERRTAASLSCDFNGNRFQSPIAQDDLRAALDGADTTTTDGSEA